MVDGYVGGAANKVGSLIELIHPHLTEPPSTSQAYKWIKYLKPVDQAVALDVAGTVLMQMGYPSGVEKHPLMSTCKNYHLFLGVMKRAYRLFYKLIFKVKKPLRDKQRKSSG